MFIEEKIKLKLDMKEEVVDSINYKSIIGKYLHRTYTQLEMQFSIRKVIKFVAQLQK